MKKNGEQEENLVRALSRMEKERGVSVETMIEQIKKAITTACKTMNKGNDDISIEYDPVKGCFMVTVFKTVVETVNEPGLEISLQAAKRLKSSAMIGDRIGVPQDPKQFNRNVISNAKNLLRQGIQESEKNRLLDEYQSKLKDIITAVVESVDPETGKANLRIGKYPAILPKDDQIPGEVLHPGDSVKVYVVTVRAGEKSPRVILSRTKPELVKRLFEEQVPEIHDGIVEVMNVSREAGSRTKIAVFSKDPDVDAVGACIGPKGQRVSTVVSQLGGEKIDIIEYSSQPEEYIKKALSPAEVLEVVLDPSGERICRATVPDSQLSLAIGNKGQNVRLAARLTEWKIDIKPESGFFGEDEDEPAPVQPLPEETPEEEPSFAAAEEASAPEEDASLEETAPADADSSGE